MAAALARPPPLLGCRIARAWLFARSCEAMSVVPVLPVRLATQLSLGLIASGLLLFALAALQQRFRRQG